MPAFSIYIYIPYLSGEYKSHCFPLNDIVHHLLDILVVDITSNDLYATDCDPLDLAQQVSGRTFQAIYQLMGFICPTPLLPP